jgi:cell division transport system permease protein
MIKRTFAHSFKNVRRAPFQALGSVFILLLTFFAAQAFVLVSLGSQVLLTYFGTQPQVTAFFTDKVDEATILQIKQQLESQSYIAKVTYVSKEEALKLYQQQNQNDPLLLEMVTADILPPSLEVSAKSMEYLPKINDDLKQISGVDEVAYQKDVIEALQRWTRGIRTSGVVLVGFLVATSIIITSIIISMKVAQKRNEIKIFRLLGATPWYVKGPFIIEGMIYGMASALLAWVFLYIILLYSTPLLLSFIGDIPLLPVPFLTMLMLLGGSVGAGALMGFVSGSISTSRY